MSRAIAEAGRLMGEFVRVRSLLLEVASALGCAVTDAPERVRQLLDEAFRNAAALGAAQKEATDLRHRLGVLRDLLGAGDMVARVRGILDENAAMGREIAEMGAEMARAAGGPAEVAEAAALAAQAAQEERRLVQERDAAVAAAAAEVTKSAADFQVRLQTALAAEPGADLIGLAYAARAQNERRGLALEEFARRLGVDPASHHALVTELDALLARAGRSRRLHVDAHAAPPIDPEADRIAEEYMARTAGPVAKRPLRAMHHAMRCATADVEDDWTPRSCTICGAVTEVIEGFVRCTAPECAECWPLDGTADGTRWDEGHRAGYAKAADECASDIGLLLDVKGLDWPGALREVGKLAAEREKAGRVPLTDAGLGAALRPLAGPGKRHDGDLMSVVHAAAARLKARPAHRMSIEAKCELVADPWRAAATVPSGATATGGGAAAADAHLRPRTLALGEPVEEGGHTFVLLDTGEDGLHSGRPRYRVTCKTCDVVVHEGTTGPREMIARHLREAAERAPRVVVDDIDDPNRPDPEAVKRWARECGWLPPETPEEKARAAEAQEAADRVLARESIIEDALRPLVPAAVLEDAVDAVMMVVARCGDEPPGEVPEPRTDEGARELAATLRSSLDSLRACIREATPDVNHGERYYERRVEALAERTPSLRPARPARDLESRVAALESAMEVLRADARRVNIGGGR